MFDSVTAPFFYQWSWVSTDAVYGHGSITLSYLKKEKKTTVTPQDYTKEYSYRFSLSAVLNWLYKVLVLFRAPSFPAPVGVLVVLGPLSKLKFSVDPTPLSCR